MRCASPCVIACLGILCACWLGGCAGGHEQPGAAMSTGESASMAVVDDWFYEDDGSVIIIPDGACEFSKKCNETIASTFGAFTIVGAEISASGGIRAIEIKPLAGMEGMKDGDWFLCASLRVDLKTKTAEFVVGAENDDCCKMKTEMAGSVVRLSCSGTCDNGEECELKHEMDGQINVWTCACPATP